MPERIHLYGGYTQKSVDFDSHHLHFHPTLKRNALLRHCSRHPRAAGHTKESSDSQRLQNMHPYLTQLEQVRSPT